ncbi:hypothetical protein [Prevotella ihumii]|uniref:hypothetical protein n=1 Tax=Prevotella ihumii TaxID=1917878 RepID=UPI000981F286|nr:hypothetical protein [Prevotella ihumii]
MEQTKQQIERFLKKIAQKFPATDEPTTMTDIHVRVSQSSGDLMAFDDEGNEITRCVVEKWIDNTEDNFNENVTALLRSETLALKDIVDNWGIMKPFSLVLEEEDEDATTELYLADDDTIILSDELLPGLEEDLDEFIKNLIP